jgi:LuxR family maltose regulon positive regulatory protein
VTTPRHVEDSPERGSARIGDEVLVGRERLLAAIATRGVTVIHGPAGTGKSVLLRQHARAQAEAGLRVITARDARDDASVVEQLADALACAADIDAVEAALRGAHSGTIVVIDPLPRTFIGTMMGLAGRLPELSWVAAARSWAEQTAAPDAVIGFAELAFTSREVGVLAVASGIALSPESSALVSEITGGWGLLIGAVIRHLSAIDPPDADAVVAALEASDSSFSAWLLGSVMDPSDVRLLTQLSIAERVTVPIAEFLSGEREIMKRLDRLVERGLLRRYAQGALLPEFEVPPHLRSLALAAAEGTDLVKKRSELARWLRTVGEPEQALRHAVAGQEWTLVAQLFERSWMDLYAANEPLTMAALQQIPVEFVRRYPKTHAVKYIVQGEVMGADELPRLSVRAWADAIRGAGSAGLIDVIEVAIAQVIVLRRSGRFAEAARLARIGQHLALVIGSRVPPYMYSQMPMARLQVALAFELAGDRQAAEEHLAIGLTTLQAAPDVDPAVRNELTGFLALKAAHEGDETASRTWLARQTAIDRAGPRIWLMPRTGSGRAIAEALLALDHLDIDGAARAIDGIEADDRDDELWPWTAPILARLALLRPDGGRYATRLDALRANHGRWINAQGVGLGMLAAAEVDLQLGRGRASAAAATLAPLNGRDAVLRLARARLASVTGDGGGAERELRSLLRSRGLSLRVRLDAWVLRATIAVQRGDQQVAMIHWEQARRLAIERADPLLPFATVSRQALQWFASAGAEDAASILQRLEEAGTIDDLLPFGQQIIRLTPREVKVLRELAHSSSMNEIAEVLFLSPATVRVHARAIYRKLDAHSREEALSIARGYGLV